MIHFLDLDNFIKGLIPVTSTEYFTRTEEFNPTGLFSEVIFGPLESKERKTTYSYIDLNSEVIHPSAMKLLIQLDRRIKDFISTEKLFSLDEENKLIIDDEKGVTGLREFKKLFPMINLRGESEKRDKYIKKLKESYENNKMFIRYVPVIPTEQRPIYKDEEKNKWMVDNLNDYYINILKKSFHMRSETSEGVLYDLLNYEVQKAVIDHDEYIRTLIQKKSGLIRSQLLGKRTDFSGRAVITPGPELDINQLGLPLKLAINLFEPFILHKLMYTKIVDHKELGEEIKKFNGMDLSIDAVKQVMKSISIGDALPVKLKKMFWMATEAAMEGRVVLLKRDPVLHPGSIRGYYPKLYDGNTMRLCTLQVTMHNADFDGDSGIFNIEIMNKDEKSQIYFIGDLEKKELDMFEQFEYYVRKDNVNVTKFKPKQELFIKSINMEKGEIENKKITEFSKHGNIELYGIEDKKNRFEKFWASYDHSLIVYDEQEKEIKKISPRELLEKPEGKFLLKQK